jgi:hypothetical protein
MPCSSRVMEPHIARTIASHFRSIKDAVKFASLSPVMWEPLFGPNNSPHTSSWALTVTEAATDLNIMQWLETYGHTLHFLTIKRCSTHRSSYPKKLKQLNRLQFLYCRVSPYILTDFVDCASRLTSLRMHQLEPGEDPGCLTHLLKPFTALRRLSLTCTSNWGIVSIGPLELPHLEYLELRTPGTLVHPCEFQPTIKVLVMHAGFVCIPHGIQLPKACTSIDLRSVDTWLDLPSLFHGDPYIQLHTLIVETAGIVFPEVITRQIPFLKTFRCKSDTFLLRPLSSSLVYLDIDVRAYFVCDTTLTRDEIAYFKRIPHIRLSQYSRLCNLETMF